MVDYNKILYTPLSSNPFPRVDKQKFRDWVDENIIAQRKYSGYIANNSCSAENHVQNYPWNLTPIFMNYYNEMTGWLGNFDKIFPELANHIVTSFDIPLDKIGAFIILPLKPKHQGIGFWHSDIDLNGMRMYLDFDDYKNHKLLIKQCKEYRTVKNRNPYMIPTEKQLNSNFLETRECKIQNENQCFFLNNFNAVHTIYTNPKHLNGQRTTLLVIPRADNNQELMKISKKKVIDSYLNYKESAVYGE